MTMTNATIRAGIRGAARNNLRRALGERLPFVTGGALAARAAEHGFYAWEAGRLSGPDREAWLRDAQDVRYVVLSYETPIYWECADGSAHKVAQRFSATTSQHQGLLYLLNSDGHIYLED